MSPPIKINVTEYHLRLARELYPSETPKLRGFFGKAFESEILIHHHRPDGSLLYNYPRVQFKVIDRTALLLGLNEGSELLSKLWFEVERTTIGIEELPVIESKMSRRQEILGENPEPLQYQFLTPWLALNQENERRYAAAIYHHERVSLLEKTLVGNCLSLAKAFKNTVDTTLKADCKRLRKVGCTLKGTPMNGFIGTFSINFFLPNMIGIGKSVSRGFGTVECVPYLSQMQGGKK